MSVQEGQQPFIPPLPRMPAQIWTAIYRMSHRDLLAAVEKAIDSVPPPIEGYNWLYDGFGRKTITFYHFCYGAPPVEAMINVRFEGETITLWIRSNIESELLLFRRLTAELDQQPAVVAARITPCTYQGVDGPRFSYLNY